MYTNKQKSQVVALAGNLIKSLRFGKAVSVDAFTDLPAGQYTFSRSENKYVVFIKKMDARLTESNGMNTNIGVVRVA